MGFEPHTPTDAAEPSGISAHSDAGITVLSLTADRAVSTTDTHEAFVEELTEAVSAALASGSRRVELRIPADDKDLMRAATRAGLRKEGVLRGGTPSGDALLVARVVDDPEVGSGEMFRATLNAGLPRKRSISQALIRNEAGQVLLCELTYKAFWDLPGGVVDPGESPAAAVLRELQEELQVEGRIVSLPVIAWLTPWRGWDDAVLTVFDVRVPAEQVERARLEPREIQAVHWADLEVVRTRCAPYTAQIIEEAIAAVDDAAGTVYLEGGTRPQW